ncbi:death-associated protein kinase 2-like [Clytia hemisphaerica]|uniref:Protein kinase domain-containing protein n=1 Tax=Clytia hemisphaerica TaxID=252671 RepID=A0A7M5XIM3_9CNID
MAPQAIMRKERMEDIYDIKEELGRGHFAVVKKCVCKSSNDDVAGKFIKVKKTRASRQGAERAIIEREAEILQMINCDKVMKLYDVFDLGSEIVLVMELLTGGELFDKLCEEDYLTEEQACDYTKQVVQGMAYLHSKNIMHLDIKPENIVLKSPDSTEIKLVDFGLAQLWSPDKEIKEMMGTAEFVAPEIVNYEKIGLCTDMWAVGVLAYILLSGESPFLGDDNQETFQNIAKADYEFDEEIFEDISEDAIDFVKGLLIKNPGKRTTAQDCLSHEWIKPKTNKFQMVRVIIKTTRLKAFVARRKWQESLKKMKAISAFQSAFNKD